MNTVNIKLIGEKDYYVQEAYKVLRTNVRFCGNDIRVISITSCDENEGKTTVSLELAKSLADLGKPVLVIDADMRKSVMVGRNSTAKKVVGLSELLTGMAQAEEAVYKTQYPNLYIMFAGKYPPNPVELLSSNVFSLLLDASRKVYSYIIIDTPPLGRVIDAAVIAPKTDGCILLIGKENIRYRQAQEVIDQLHKSGSKILGVVKNNMKKHSGSYGRAYNKYKYRRYDYHGANQDVTK